MSVYRFRKIRKITVYFIMFLFIMSLIGNYKYYEVKKRQQYEYEVFLNHFYFSVQGSLRTIDIILDTNMSADKLEKEIERLTYHLNRIDYYLTDGAIFVEGINHKGITLAKVGSQTIKYGNKYGDTTIKPFDEDNRISESEKAYLIGLRSILDDIHGKLYSDETGQEKDNLSKNAFNNIINDGSLGSNYEHNLLKEYTGKKQF